MNCPTCRYPMRNITGIGMDQPEYFCENPNCMSHYGDVQCKCGAKAVKVQTLGMGDHVFTCKNGHQFEVR